MLELSQLPKLNACLNSTVAIVLVLALVAIKNRRFRTHGWLMSAALALSALFLTSYLTYHYKVGHTTFPDLGWVRTAYLALLASHVILAVVVTPMAITAVVFAARRQFDRHRRVTRILWPLWFYVAVTGVLIYVILYHLI